MKCNNEDSQRHLFYSKCFPSKKVFSQGKVKYEDIFSSDHYKAATSLRHLLNKYNQRQFYLSSQQEPEDLEATPFRIQRLETDINF